MITGAVQNRKRKLEENQNQMVEMRPEFVEALRRCETFSRKFSFLSLLL